MTISIRRARAGDIPHLAYAYMEAGGGLIDALYEGVIPNRETHLIVEHLYSRPDATTSFANCWVAENGETVIGAINAFPIDVMADEPDDPLVPEDRLYLLKPFEHLHPDGSYYIMVLAVYPEFRRGGAGRRLIAEAEADAKAQGFTEASLSVFSENHGSVKFYEALGYKEVSRRAVVDHPLIRFGGDYMLMTRRL